jgi:hypothetical protein
MLKITANYYDHIPGYQDEKFIIFVNGHALVEDNPQIAWKLAKENGQSKLPMTVYGTDGPLVTYVKL